MNFKTATLLKMNGQWYMPVIPTFGRLRLEDCEFDAILDYRMSSAPPGLHREILSLKKKKIAGRVSSRLLSQLLGLLWEDLVLRPDQAKKDRHPPPFPLS
jgi:hypothetical protein